jgi:predicted nucleic acid-binding Zn ribbon protein
MSREGFVPLRDIRLGAAGRDTPRPAADPRREPRPRISGPAVPLAVLQAWSRVVRAPLSERAVPTGWHEGVLTLRVEEPRWRATLEILAPSLCSELNAWIGEAVITEVRFQSGRPER